MIKRSNTFFTLTCIFLLIYIILDAIILLTSGFAAILALIFSQVFTIVAFYAMFCITDNQEDIIELLKQLTSSRLSSNQHTPPASPVNTAAQSHNRRTSDKITKSTAPVSTTASSEAPVQVTLDSNGMIVCPNCKKHQAVRENCYNCGVKFDIEQ